MYSADVTVTYMCTHCVKIFPYQPSLAFYEEHNIRAKPTLKFKENRV